MRNSARARVAGAATPAAREAASKPLPQRLDRLIHDRTRLAILAALAASEPLAFTDLKDITGSTDGNLSVHARRLDVDPSIAVDAVLIDAASGAADALEAAARARGFHRSGIYRVGRSPTLSLWQPFPLASDRR